MPTIPTVIKQPAESRLYTMEFASLFDEGETITGIVSVTKDKVTVPDLVISGETFIGSTVQFRLAAGQTNTKYKITVKVNTSAGNLIEGDGIIQCEDL